MNKPRKDKAVDNMFLIALAFALTALIVCYSIGQSGVDATSEAAVAFTTAEATAAIHEPAETEQPATAAPAATAAAETEPTQPTVALYDVPLDDSLQLHIIEQAESYGIDPAIIVAMAWKESTYRADAIGDGGNSYGLCQIQPRWHYSRMQKLGCTDLLDPYQNVTVAIDYLCELLNRYGSTEAALTAYNRGSYNGTVTNYANTVMAKAEGLVHSYDKADRGDNGFLGTGR